jgi:hypothetical protein
MMAGKRHAHDLSALQFIIAAMIIDYLVAAVPVLH